MAIDLQTSREAGPSEPSLTSLMAGIVQDSQELFKQHLALLKVEINEDLRKTKEGALSLAAGLGILLVGVAVLSFMAAHLLQWAFPQLALWAAYGIVGGTLTVIGGGLLYAGLRQLNSIHPLPEQSLETMKENVQWIIKPK